MCVWKTIHTKILKDKNMRKKCLSTKFLHKEIGEISVFYAVKVFEF